MNDAVDHGRDRDLVAEDLSKHRDLTRPIGPVLAVSRTPPALNRQATQSEPAALIGMSARWLYLVPTEERQ